MNYFILDLIKSNGLQITIGVLMLIVAPFLLGKIIDFYRTEKYKKKPWNEFECWLGGGLFLFSTTFIIFISYLLYVIYESPSPI
jgi:hypothetical protein